MNAMYGLQHQVQTALMDQRILENEGIEVLDSNGIITLRGSVSSVEARETAEAIARSVTGVVNVINELDVV
jgi:osmotically-inducible protein OsmY